ncbi:double-strand break repair protein AddB [Hyphococcus sp.]|uniref:double-strand break repair protein AddB n=1 Tax=Hyphococcus sp. TaxID=2038636 RepID=UPI003CCBD007
MVQTGDIFDGPAPRVFSIAPGRAFLKDLADGVASTAAKNGFQLPDVTIYLPTRRAMRALGEAFVEISSPRAVLAPRIRALGDIDEDEFVVFSGGAEDEADLSPPISTEHRRLTLARLVAERDKAYFQGQRRWAGAISAADELGKLLDSLYTEEISADRLGGVVPEELARHWRDSLEFLSLITAEWPEILKAQDLSDPAARRVALIERQTRRWRENPPRNPVIIAGTTGSAPAVARMMGVVSRLPAGAVVLPGLDLDAPASVWNSVDEPHPQSGLKALIESLELTREQVRPWPVSSVTQKNPRADIVTVALRPAGASDEWRDWAAEAKAAKASMDEATRGLALVEASDEEREAGVIALKIRETIETPDRTVMLVTPNRDLARRVALKMRRWDVNIDDSAGSPFANTQCGVFLRLVADWLGAVSDPVRLMALIDHPLFGGGLSLQELPRVRRLFDRGLRGLKPGPGVAGLRRKLDPALSGGESLETLLSALETAAALWPETEGSFAERFHAHLAAAEQLCALAEAPGDKRLWRGDDGEAGAALLAQIEPSLSLIVQDRAEEYADIFTRLIAGGIVRRRMPAHPRIAILGPLEARMQTADVVILGGLNEGVWPHDAVTDPFLSRPMREKLGLPSPERRIGLAAHDFAQLTSMGDVLLTRSTRAAGKPTKPSRWIIRLKNILEGAEAAENVYQARYWEGLADSLDRPQPATRIAAPFPTPPVAARPQSLSVTQIETLLRDPYALYASKVLRLDPLDPLGEAFGPRYLGNLFHLILELFAREHGGDGAANFQTRLRELFNKHASDFGLDATALRFRIRQIDAAFDRLEDWFAERAALGVPAVLEGKGAWIFALDDKQFRLSARADRIDVLTEGGAYIIDYKTGAPPSLEQQKAMFSPQLPLTGLIVEKGGFGDIGAARVAGFEFLRVLGGRTQKDRTANLTGDEARRLMDETRDGLFSILRHFADPAAGYPSQPRPQYANRFGAYDHLARRREREAHGDDGAGDNL